MYRQRPAYPALVLAGVVAAVGFIAVCCLKQRVENGEYDATCLLLTAFTTIGITGALVITAFARYQFTHLWKRPNKTTRQRNRQHRRHGNHATSRTH